VGQAADEHSHGSATEVRSAKALAFHDGDFAADIRDYELVHRHIVMMADAISGAIIRQFPGRFR
jgi:hypothetical protein